MKGSSDSYISRTVPGSRLVYQYLSLEGDEWIGHIHTTESKYDVNTLYMNLLVAS